MSAKDLTVAASKNRQLGQQKGDFQTTNSATGVFGGGDRGQSCGLAPRSLLGWSPLPRLGEKTFFGNRLRMREGGLGAAMGQEAAAGDGSRGFGGPVPLQQQRHRLGGGPPGVRDCRRGVSQHNTSDEGV